VPAYLNSGHNEAHGLERFMLQDTEPQKKYYAKNPPQSSLVSNLTPSYDSTQFAWYFPENEPSKANDQTFYTPVDDRAYQ